MKIFVLVVMIILALGLGAICVWQVIKLAQAINARRKSKRIKEDAPKND